jgi:Flp pilus assembly protein TadG
MPIAARIVAASLRALRRDGGSAAVEMAMLAPILCLLGAMMIDFGFAVYTKMVVANAAQAGAAYAQFNSSSATSCTTNTPVSSPCTFDQNVESAATKVTLPGSGYASGLSATATVYYCCVNSSNAIDFSNCTQPQTGTKPTCSSGTYGTYVQVTASANYSPIVPYQAIANAFNISFIEPTSFGSTYMIRVN